MDHAKELFHNINLKRKTYFDPLIKEVELSLIDIEILAFIDKFPENNTFTDILNSKEYSKSHVSASITRLIDRGYLIRENNENNKKVFYLKLKEKSSYTINEYKKYVKVFRKDALQGIPQEDIDNFMRLLEKINTNLK